MLRRMLSNHHAVIWSLFAIGFLVRAHGLSSQPPTDDEVGAASAATNYVRSGLFGSVMWYHPPLRNIVVFLSGRLFGEYSAWGLRFGSLLFGSLTVPALGYTAHQLFGKKRITYLTAFFLCIDPLHISLSREAFQETTTAFFLVAGVLASVKAVKTNSVFWCYIAGGMFGISTASKWHGLFPWAVSAVAYMAAPWLLPGQAGERRITGRLLTTFAAYGMVPLAIYTAAYLPWILRGYSLPEFFRLQKWLVQLQYIYISTPYTEDVLSHRAYQWFLWPVAWVDFVFYQGKTYLNIAIGNYLIWVLTLPALYGAILSWWRRRTFPLGLSITLFLISYLPLVLTSRSIWVFAAPAVIPFAFILSAYMIGDLIERQKLAQTTLAVYLALAVGLSMLLYPLGTFRALEQPWARFLAEQYSPHHGETGKAVR